MVMENDALVVGDDGIRHSADSNDDDIRMRSIEVGRDGDDIVPVSDP